VKKVHLSRHASMRALMRGATEKEVLETIERGIAEPAKRGKWQSRCHFPGEYACADGKSYIGKTVEVIFAEEPDALVVVTVKVYYEQGGAR